MEIKVIDSLLMDVFIAREFNLQRARVLVRKGLVLRTRGIDNLSSCFDCLSEAISLLVPAKNEMYFFAGQIYYDLAERLLASGRVFEGLSYAKEALNLRYKVLRKKFNVSNKKPVEHAESSTTNVELDHLCLELLGSAINEVWRDTINLERCTLGPWIILNSYLESQVYRKKLFWDLAEDELNIARKLLQENDTMISCKHCKLTLEVTIDMLFGDLSMKRSNKGSHVQSHALDLYRAAFRKLCKDMVESSLIAPWKQESIGESFSTCHLEGTKHRVINNSKSYPSENNKKLPSCNICSFLECRFDAHNIEQLSSARETALPLCAECGESNVQTTIKKNSRNGSKQLSKTISHDTELKPRRSSRNRSFHNKQIISAQNEIYSSVPYRAFDADIFSCRTSQIKENGTCSFDFGCCDGGVCRRMECLRCLCLKVSRLIASLILLSTVDGSIPPPLCSKESLSLSHWAAFFHQASIGSVVNYQYLSFVRDKACSFKAGKGMESENVLETDMNVNYISRTMEDEWIGPWGCLLLGERLDAESLEKLAARMSNCLNSQCDFMVNDNLIKVILNGAQSVFAAEACIAQSLLYKGFFGRGGCCGEQRFRAFSDHSKGVKCMLTSIHNLILEAVDEGMTVDRQPIILILDTDVQLDGFTSWLQMLSWENMPILKNQEVYRMPSLGSILLKLNQHCSEKKNTFEVNLPYIDPFRAYYLLNPSGDLSYTQQQFEEWFRNHKWEVG
ncbi:separase [Dendrobium catenatum]|uniref:separase n=1 Tax=Dendrobium catenatum TaxID=906689 RepID=A0A2I0XD96_9ASPA|nr:separase [Dendrobium catenatum]